MTGTSDGANGSMTEGYIYLFNDPLKEGKGWLEKYYKSDRSHVVL